MDEFISSVKSRVFELSNLDVMVMPANIRFVFIYENKDNSADFMPFDAIRQSFYKALQEFPIFAGHLREAEYGGVSVVVDKNNLNMPEYQELQSEIHYSALKAANFSWGRWPKETAVPAVISADASGVIKLVKIKIVRLKDNSGVIVIPAVAHVLVDGVGYFEFLNTWAGICRQERTGAASPLHSNDALVFDRSLVKKSLPLQRKPLDSFTQWFFLHFSIISAFIAWLALVTRLRLLKVLSLAVSTEAHMFHLSRESLDSMLASAREFMPKGKRLSDNDLICALVAKTFAQSETETAAEKILSFIASRVFRKAGKEILVGLCCDTRYRLGIADKNFMGSCTILPFWKFSCAELKVPTAPESLAAIAKRVRNVVDTIDAEYMGSFMDVIDSNPSFHAQIFSCAVKYSTFTLTNHTRFNLYGTDFGDGVQQWSSYIPGLKYNVAMIQPCPPGTDGVNIFLEADTRAMQGILRNAFWMSIAEVIY